MPILRQSGRAFLSPTSESLRFSTLLIVRRRCYYFRANIVLPCHVATHHRGGKGSCSLFRPVLLRSPTTYSVRGAGAGAFMKGATAQPAAALLPKAPTAADPEAPGSARATIFVAAVLLAIAWGLAIWRVVDTAYYFRVDVGGGDPPQEGLHAPLLASGVFALLAATLGAALLAATLYVGLRRLYVNRGPWPLRLLIIGAWLATLCSALTLVDHAARMSVYAYAPRADRPPPEVQTLPFYGAWRQGVDVIAVAATLSYLLAALLFSLLSCLACYARYKSSRHPALGPEPTAYVEGVRPVYEPRLHEHVV